MNLFSILAYEQVVKDLSDRQRAVYGALFELRRGTLDQVADRMRVPKHTISGRITELKDKGLIREARGADGQRLRGKTNGGRSCAVLEICAEI